MVVKYLKNINVEKYGKWAAVLVGALVLLMLVKKQIRAAINTISTPSDLKTKEAIQKAGQSADVSSLIVNSARDIYTAFHSSIDEDEDTAVTAVNQMNTAEQVQLLSKVYREKYDLSLKADFGKYAWMDVVFRVKTVVKNNWQ